MTSVYDMIMDDIHPPRYRYKLGDEVVCRKKGKFFDRITIGVIEMLFTDHCTVTEADGRQSFWDFRQIRPRPHSSENMKLILRMVK